jgi:hypothetical protein
MYTVSSKLGVRVHVRPEAHPDGLQVIDELVLRKRSRAVERHVLQEVRQPALVVVLQDEPTFTTSRSSARPGGSALART